MQAHLLHLLAQGNSSLPWPGGAEAGRRMIQIFLLSQVFNLLHATMPLYSQDTRKMLILSTTGCTACHENLVHWLSMNRRELLDSDSVSLL
jgi:hypothetical protein